MSADSFFLYEHRDRIIVYFVRYISGVAVAYRLKGEYTSSHATEIVHVFAITRYIRDGRRSRRKGGGGEGRSPESRIPRPISFGSVISEKHTERVLLFLFFFSGNCLSLRHHHAYMYPK